MGAGKVQIPHLGRHFWNYLLVLHNILKMQNVKNARRVLFITEYLKIEIFQNIQKEFTAMWVTATPPKHFLLHERRKGRFGRFPVVLPTPIWQLWILLLDMKNYSRVKSWAALQHNPRPGYLSHDVGSRLMSEKADRAQIYLSKSNAVCLAKLSEL